ncbi:MAG: GlsB/YeaQ/YmgE family stress response membrane protein [Anaerolineae bacterium]|nr:GlsB/YeaQ/YmgE family stress response membrane protein [Anaerolineae bacterium]
MGWLAWLIVGALAGWLASIVMRTNASQGLLLDIIVGIIGAFIGGFLFNIIGAPGVTGFNIWSVFVAFIGAIVLLGILRMFSRPTVP